MPRYIIRLDDFLLEWSTIVDAPVTYGMNREDFEAYYKDQYGAKGMAELGDRLERVAQKGTSAMFDDSAEDTISCNRAGYNETELTRAEIIKIYCVEKRNPVEGEGTKRPYEEEEGEGA